MQRAEKGSGRNLLVSHLRRCTDRGEWPVVAGYWFGNPDRIVVSSTSDEYLVRHGAFAVGASLFMPSRALLSYDRHLLYLVTIENRGAAGWMNVADGWIFELREVDRSNAFGALYPTGLQRLFWRAGEVRTYAATLQAPTADSMRVSVFLGRQRDTLVFRLR